tara:strand:+ start:901 stop:1815 length:915 start_codon:yes stop_codon:yes gene_type:complete
MVSVTQLQYILAVEKEQNFHRAAKACFVTQPTLSKMIKNLEEDLGVAIFDRSKSPVAPTLVGKSILKQAKQALYDIERIREIVDEQKGEIRGELKVGIIPTIAPYLVPNFLASFRSQYPAVELSIWELTTENCLQALDKEQIDLAILATEENKQNYYQEALYDEAMYLYINEKHPLAKRTRIHIDDLEADQMWLLEEGHCLRDEIIKLCHLRRLEANRPLGLDIKIGNLESLRYLVQENFGYTLLPELSAIRLPAKEKKLLRTFNKPIPFRSVNLTMRRRYLKQASIQALKAEILTNTKKQLKL